MTESSSLPRHPSAGGVFVGRQREMAELKTALDDALSGQGRLVMLVGQPGIGKTRTAQELASHAQERGAQVLWGRCSEEQGAPPYWPWVQTIRAYVQRTDPETLRSEMGPGAADIAEIVPDIRGKLPDLETPPELEPEQARFRLFDSVCSFLNNAAHSQTLVLLLDDLHWADKPSLLLLEFLAREMGGSPLLVVGCYRDVELSRQHPLSDTLAQLSREPVFRREPLPGLSEEDTGHFIEATAGVEPQPGLVGVLYSHTEGNPFFLTQVIRLLSERGDLGAEEISLPLDIRVPEGVREVIGQRLNRVSEQCNQALTVASVIGQEFDFRILNKLIDGTGEDQLLTAMDEAVSARLMEEVPGARDRYQFSHALIQQTLAEELTTSRRVRMHARIGEALEELYGDEVDTHAAELASHFAEAEPVLGPEKLVRYSLKAGERALAVYAHEEAQAHFERGLAARGIPLTGSEPAPDAEAAALLFGLGQAQLATFERVRIDESDTSLNRAFEYYFREGDAAKAVAVAEISSIATRSEHRRQRITRALTLVPSDSYQAGRLLSCYIAALGDSQSDYQEIQEVFGRAMTIAQRENDLALEMRTLVAAGHADAYHLRFEKVLEKNLRAIELARHVGYHLDETHAQYEVASVLYAMGDLEGAGRHAAAVLPPAERTRNRYWLTRCLGLNATVALGKGDWSSARYFNDRGLAVSPQDPSFLGGRAVLEYQVGDFTQGEVYLERLLEVLRQWAPEFTATASMIPALVVPVITRITGRIHHPEVVATFAEPVLSSPFAPPIAVLNARLGLAILAVERRDVGAAQEHYHHLAPLRGTRAPPQIVYGVGPVVDRLLGLLAQTIGNLDQAAEHFEDALAFCRKAGYLPELAWTCHDYAEALLQCPSTGSGPAVSDDRDKTIYLLEEALAISSELGMRPLMERVVALQERAESQPAKAPVYPDGLTHREVEVLRLVASGKSSAEIAAELVLSRRTVERHISNIYNKTNTRSRAEATAFAFTHGLASST